MSFDGIDGLFARKLYSQIEARKAEVVADVVSSRGVNDFASYQRLIGHIAALDEVIGMFSTVQSKISQEGSRR